MLIKSGWSIPMYTFIIDIVSSCEVRVRTFAVVSINDS